MQQVKIINGKVLNVIKESEGCLQENAVRLAFENLQKIDPVYAESMVLQRVEGPDNKGSFYRLTAEEIKKAIVETPSQQVFGNKNIFPGAYLFEGELSGILGMVEKEHLAEGELILASLVKGRGFSALVFREKDQLPAVSFSNFIVGTYSVPASYKEAYTKAVKEEVGKKDKVTFENFGRPVTLSFTDLELKIKAADVGIKVLFTLYPGTTKAINKIETAIQNGYLYTFDEIQVIAETNFRHYKETRLAELTEQGKTDSKEFADLENLFFQGESSFKAVDLTEVHRIAEELEENGELNETIIQHLITFTKGAFSPTVNQ